MLVPIGIVLKTRHWPAAAIGRGYNSGGMVRSWRDHQ